MTSHPTPGITNISTATKPAAPASRPYLASTLTLMMTYPAANALAARMASTQVPSVLPVMDSGESERYCCGAGGVTMVGSAALLDVVGPIMIGMPPQWGRVFGCMSTEALAETVRRLKDDTRVKGLAIRMACPGGSTPGSEAIIKAVAEFSAAKPSLCIVAHESCSLAQFIGAACRKVVASQNAILGSIGEMVCVEDWSGWSKQNGVESIAITDQDLKAFGLSMHAVTPDMRANVLDMVRDQVGPYIDEFAARRKMTPQAVRDLRGGLFSAVRGKQIGLVDEIADPDQALAQFVASLSQSTQVRVEPPASGVPSPSPESKSKVKGAHSMTPETIQMLAGLRPDDVRQHAPALADAIGNEFAQAKSLVPKAQAASIEELESEFGSNPKFVIECMKAKLSMPEAHARFSNDLKAQLQAATTELATMKAASGQPPKTPMGNTAIPSSARPASPETPASGPTGQPQTAFMARCQRETNEGLHESIHAAFAANAVLASNNAEINAEWQDHQRKVGMLRFQRAG